MVDNLAWIEEHCRRTLKFPVTNATKLEYATILELISAYREDERKLEKISQLIIDEGDGNCSQLKRISKVVFGCD